MTAKIDELIVEMQRALGVTSVVVTHDMAKCVPYCGPHCDDL